MDLDPGGDLLFRIWGLLPCTNWLYLKSIRLTNQNGVMAVSHFVRLVFESAPDLH